MQKKSNKRQIQAQNTKERIKDCAMELFKEKGYYNTSVEEIAKQAQSSIGGFYHHFKSKDEIMIYNMKKLDKEYLDYFNEVLTGPEYSSLNSLEKIKAMVIYIIRHICRGGEEFVRVSYSYLLKDEETGLMMVNSERVYFKIMEHLIKKCIEDGIIKNDLQEKNVLCNITILIRGIIVDWCINRNSYDLEIMSSSILDSFFTGISKCENP